MWWALAGSGSGSGRYEDRPAGIRSPTHGNLEVVAAASSKGKRRSKGFVAQWQVALLGIALVMAGEVMFWNVPYKHINFQEYIINVFILGSAFIAASLCLAEITGTLPFAGMTQTHTMLTFTLY